MTPTTVKVADQIFEGRHVLPATGSYPKSPPGLDIDGQKIVTSDQALQLDDIPSSVIVLGGGVIGVEFTIIWKLFGVDVSDTAAIDEVYAQALAD